MAVLAQSRRYRSGRFKFGSERVLTISPDRELEPPPAPAAGFDLAEALRNGWIEFWYGPKIDLRQKQLVGVEASARARHPQDGVLMPSAIMPGATDADLIALSELALTRGLAASLNFAELGAKLPLAVNIPLAALAKMAMTDILQTYRPHFAVWPGLTVEVREEEIVADIALARGLAEKLKALDVRLAIDDCGHDHAALAGLTDMAVAELKLDSAFVADCATDKFNAALCNSVIDLAHSFGKSATATGIEKAADAFALIDMGCDYGQGFLLGRPMVEERFTALLRQRAAAQPARV
jgi:EAL domain-containing protein (putative c-di-GMP-specific phosphodiesterase class I)